MTTSSIVERERSPSPPGFPTDTSLHSVLTDILVVLSSGVDDLLGQLGGNVGSGGGYFSRLTNKNVTLPSASTNASGSLAERDVLQLVWRTVHYCVENLLYHMQRAAENRRNLTSSYRERL